MEYTKGDWKVIFTSEGHGIYSQYEIMGDKHETGTIAIVYDYNNFLSGEDEGEANADLIVSAVNACISINPDNPQAVAESIKDMYEALTQLLDRLDYHGAIDAIREEGPIEDAKQALAKAEGTIPDNRDNAEMGSCYED